MYTLSPSDAQRVEEVLQYVRRYLQSSNDALPAEFRAVQPVDVQERMLDNVLKAVRSHETRSVALCRGAQRNPGNPADVWRIHIIYVLFSLMPFFRKATPYSATQHSPKIRPSNTKPSKAVDHYDLRRDVLDKGRSAPAT